MKYIMSLIIALLFIGCSQEVPPTKKYILDIEIPKNVNNKFTCKEKSLKILSPYASYEYTTNNLYYVLDSQEGSYTQSAWAKAPATEIYALLLKNIRKSAIFATVENYTSISQGDINLEIDIQNFKQYFSSDEKHSYVIADITLSMVDKKTFTIIAQKNFYKKVITDSADAKGGVEALNKALAELLPEMIQWIGNSCR
ncbi:MAG: hypothetical protein GXO11_01765 [Epsilonproteobacteria bacterium]|nr:hypothetical protein [Campylobacterota bacterium]